MTPLSSKELQGMRETLADTFTTLVEIWRRTTVSDPGGGQTDTWAKVHTYPTQFYGTGGNERQLPGNIVETIGDFTFYFAVDADIHQQDHIVYGDRTFNVERVGGATDALFIGLLVGANEVT
jgi:hypothetical protein